MYAKIHQVFGLINYAKIVLYLFAIFLLVGCQDPSIDPFEEDKGIFSVYGTLEVGESTHVIRIKDLSVPFESDKDLTFNGEVIFEDLSEGVTKSLEDSLVRFGQNVTHNFILDHEIKHRGEYRITVEREDGQIVESNATAPRKTIAEADPAENVECEDQINFTYSNVPEPEQVIMEVGFLYDDRMRWSEIGIVAQLQRTDAEELSVEMSPRNLLVEVFTPSLEDETGRPIPPRLLMPTVSCHELQSNTVYIRYMHLGEEWKRIHPIRPPEPTEVGDVINGLGFMGSFYRNTITFSLDS